MPTNGRFISVGTKLTIATIVVLGLVSGSVFVGLSRSQREQLLDAKELAARMAGALYLRSIAAPVLFEDDKGIADTIALVAKDPEVLAVELWAVDAERQPARRLAAHFRGAVQSGVPPRSTEDLQIERTPSRLILRGPVRDPEGQIAAVTAVQFSLARENLAFERLRRRVLLLAAGIAAALTLLLWFLTWRWTLRPLGVLMASVRQVEAGRPVVRDQASSNDEIGRLSDAFGRMADAVKRREHDVLELNATLEQRVVDRTTQLDEKNHTLEGSLEQLRATQRELIETSRKVGMADVATSVLHNVGNVLNSVNVSASVVGNLARASKGAGLLRATTLLRAQPDPGRFLREDPRGQKLLDYFDAIAQAIESERERMLVELESLTKNIDHIKVIVSMQQSHAKAGGAVERLSLSGMIEDALKFDAASYQKHSLRVVRDFEEMADIEIDRHKLLQILMNLLSNARHAVKASSGERRITIGLRSVANDNVAITVEDTGIGIPAENLNKIFNHGFTTKREGHGFGLHSCACAAIELGGAMTVHSDGIDRGAKFTVVVPRTPRTKSVAAA